MEELEKAMTQCAKDLDQVRRPPPVIASFDINEETRVVEFRNKAGQGIFWMSIDAFKEYLSQNDLERFI